MNGNSVLLDTAIIVEHFRPAGKHAEPFEAHSLYVLEIVVAELYAGALKSRRPTENLGVIEDFLQSVTLVPSDIETAKTYARVWLQLSNRGRLIPQNEIWIASLAIQHDLKLITRDAHFRRVEGLELGDWTDAGALPA